jgi:hypothetical protein
MLRLKGESEILLMHNCGEVDEAEASFRDGLQVARSEETKWGQLRTSVSLARLLRDTNRRQGGAHPVSGNLQLVHRRLRAAGS